MKRAVIYLRVSTTKQTEGASLETQQMTCQDWASRNQVLVEKIYHDDGVSAKTLDRPAMKEMLSYLESNKGKVSYVVTYQTDRLTRNAADFFALRATLSQIGVEYKNINSSLEESINDELIQGIEAVLAQHDNKVKSVRVRDNMKRHAKEGYRMSKAPHGLKNVRDVLGKSTLAPMEGVGDKVTAILEAYATGAYTVASLLTLCEEIGLQTASGKPMKIQIISKMLRNPTYAGLEQSAHTDGQLIPSRFKGVITPTVFYRNQDLLRKNKNSAAKYKRNNPEFPLRRFLDCSNCHKPITGSSPRSGSGKPSPRYHCSRCKVPSINPQELHEQFLHLLASLAPDPGMEKFLKEVIVRVWREETQTLSTQQKRLHKALEELTERKTKVIEMLVSGEITPEEKRGLTTKINEESDATEKQLASVGSMSRLKTDTIDYALQFMSNAPRIWSNASIEHQIIYQRLVFPEGLEYDLAKNEFGTSKLSRLYRLATIKKDPSFSDESHLVTPRRVELLLPG
ncbi:MAG: site-specific recombinase [Candidatus Saccharibacteria bacterium]|nr:site-specific recombinase [Candidatus Saccharibacteria bacterium]